MAIKVWDGAAFTDVENVSYWNGSAWATAEAVHQWDGSAWEQVWPAALPTFVAAATNSGTATSLAIDVPTGTVDGDEMLSLLVNAASGAATDPVGWTALDAASSFPSQGASSRRTASSEPASYTWTGLQGSGLAARGVNLSYRNVSATYASSLAVATNSSPSAPSINVAGASDIVVAVGLGTAANIPNTPSGFTSVFSAAGVRISVATPGTGATGVVAMSGFTVGANLAALFAMSPS